MFNDILKIKHHKEERALSFLKECRAKELAAEEALKLGRTTLDDYKVFRQEEKVRLFEKLQNEIVSKQKIDRFNQDVAKLKEQELAYIERLEELRKTFEQSQQATVEARTAHQKTLVDVRKYEELKDSIDEEVRKEAEVREEMEQEEIAKPFVPAF